MNGHTREAFCPPAALWHAMAEAAPTSTLLVSAECGRILYANSLGRRLAEGPDELIGALANQRLPKPIAAALAEIRRGGTALRQDCLPLPSGPVGGSLGTVTAFWDITYALLSAAVAGMPAILVTAQEVTHHVLARQEAERARHRPDAPLGPLAGSTAVPEMRLRAILQQIPAALFIVDSADGDAILHNDRLAEMLTTPRNSDEESPCGCAVHADGTPYRLEEYPSRRAFTHGITITAEPMIYRCSDGRTLDLDMFAGPIRDPDGRIVAAVSVVHDVTERKRQEAALRDSEARLRVAIEAGGLATWEIDLIRNKTSLDAAFAQLLGRPAGAFKGSRDEGRALVHPDDIGRARADLEAAIAAGDRLQTEMRVLTLDGGVAWLSVHGRVTLDQAGKPLRVTGVVADVTARRHREDRLREALAARELLVREADHRIKNSLQLICSVLSLQKTRLATPELAAALDDAMSRVQAVAQAHRALHQSTDLKTVDFGAMLHDLCAHAANLSPAIIFACHCPEPIALDTKRAIPLGLILSELLTNAAKYAYDEAGGTVVLSALAKDGIIEVTAADRGRGIPPDHREGRGIGARIVHAVARQIGASVETSSGPGGTTVILRFAQ
jgi:PAS domain S-box-containing protein